MKKKKEESTSSGTPKKQPRSSGSGRLSSMIESMQRRSSPVNAHKVATQYFDNFRQERHILEEAGAGKEAKQPSSTAVTTGETTAVITAVSTAVKGGGKKKDIKPSAVIDETVALSDILTQSESKIYSAMRKESINKVSGELRFGLKYLKETTGLSDKTIRVTIHSLEEKLCIKLVDSSQGIYGRKFRVHDPEEVFRAHKEANIYIDRATKKITHTATAVTTAVSSAVTTAVDKSDVIQLYEKYTGNKWDKKDDKFYESISNKKLSVIEAALIIGVLKRGASIKKMSDLNNTFKDLGNALEEEYIKQLRGIWESVNAASKKR